MPRPIRSLVSIAFVAGVVWLAFNLPLGRRTLAEHLDAIGRTPQAHELLDGARDTVDPALQGAKERILGERVEAPTNLPAGQPAPSRRPSQAAASRTPGRND